MYYQLHSYTSPFRYFVNLENEAFMSLSNQYIIIHHHLD